MKLLQPINVQLMSRRCFRKPAAQIEFMRFFEERLPFLKPSVFNWTDPVNKPWSLDTPLAYIPPDRNGEADTIYWGRRRKPKASGYFSVARPVNASPLGRWHGEVSLVTEFKEVNIDALVDYIKSAALHFDGDLAQVHWVCPQEKSLRDTECYFDMAGANGGSEFVTNSLMHWLPALPWAVVFGDAYVRMFGLNKLLSAPVFKVEQLSDSCVYIQLSPDLRDLETDYVAVHAVRQCVQAHLGHEAFFDGHRAYPLRGPLGDIPIGQLVKAIAEFRRLPPGSNGFRVPEFRFIED